MSQYIRPDLVIDSASTAVRSNVTVYVSGTPVMAASYTDREIAPDVVQITYTYHGERDANGWTTHWWHATDVKVTGYRVLKPGPKGEQRLSGKDNHTAHFSGYVGNSVQDKGEMPEWLDALVTHVRPSGEVHIWGGTA